MHESCFGIRPGPASVSYCLRAFALDGFLQQKDDGNTGKAHQRHIAEVINIGPEPGLDRKLAAHQSVGPNHRIRRAITLRL